MVELKSRDKQR